MSPEGKWSDRTPNQDDIISQYCLIIGKQILLSLKQPAEKANLGSARKHAVCTVVPSLIINQCKKIKFIVFPCLL